jgi:hypothetical protein
MLSKGIRVVAAYDRLAPANAMTATKTATRTRTRRQRKIELFMFDLLQIVI